MTWLSFSEYQEQKRQESNPRYSSTFAGNSPNGAREFSQIIHEKKLKTLAQFIKNNPEKKLVGADFSTRIEFRSAEAYVQDIILTGTVANTRLENANVFLFTLNTDYEPIVPFVFQSETDSSGNFSITVDESVLDENKLYMLVSITDDSTSTTSVNTSSETKPPFFIRILTYDEIIQNLPIHINLVTNLLTILTLEKLNTGVFEGYAAALENTI